MIIVTKLTGKAAKAAATTFDLHLHEGIYRLEEPAAFVFPNGLEHCHVVLPRGAHVDGSFEPYLVRGQSFVNNFEGRNESTKDDKWQEDGFLWTESTLTGYKAALVKAGIEETVPDLFSDTFSPWDFVPVNF